MASMGAIPPLNPCRPLLRSGWAYTLPSRIPCRTLAHSCPQRAQADDGRGENESNASASVLSSLKNFMLGSKTSKPKPKIPRKPSAPPSREGSLSADSIFGDETPTQSKEPSVKKDPLEERIWDNMQMALDPKPRARLRWQRKMVARTIRKRGRLTRTEEIMRTERESLLRSHFFKTSVKKLVPLARQIAGKRIDEAILQMRFSPKKAAKDVFEHLKHAKNVAIVRHGMGMDNVPGGSDTDANETSISQTTFKPTTVTLKSGKRKVISNPTAIYVDQAWVNRGPFDLSYNQRARGRIDTIRRPYTGLSVLLKEEKTLIREWEDRDAKALRQRRSQLWTQLPNRKITSQNQYYSW
ncbi:Ribosomal protein L22/L17 [Elaphomyces granulatus]